MLSMQKRLAKEIAIWYGEKPNRNAPMLARLTDVSLSSVRRAESGDVEMSKGVVLPLAAVVMGSRPKVLDAFITEFFPGMRQVVSSEHYQMNEPDDLLAFVLSDSHSPVLMLADTPSGTTLAEVKEYHGVNAVDYFEDVRHAGFLKELPDGRWQLTRSLGSLSMPHGRRLLAVLAKTCGNRSDSVKGSSYVLTGWESLKRSAADNLHAIYENAGQQAAGVYSDPANKGDVLVAYGFLFNVIKHAEESPK